MITLAMLRFCGLDIHIHMYKNGVCNCKKIENISEWLDYEYHVFSTEKVDANTWTFEETVGMMGFSAGLMYEIDVSDCEFFILAGYLNKNVTYEKNDFGDKKIYFKDLNWFKYDIIEDIQIYIKEDYIILLFYFQRGKIKSELLNNEKMNLDITLRQRLNIGDRTKLKEKYPSSYYLFNNNRVYFYCDYNDTINNEFINNKNINHRVINYSYNGLLMNSFDEKDNKKYILFEYGIMKDNGSFYNKLEILSKTLYVNHKDDFLFFDDWNIRGNNQTFIYCGLKVEEFIKFMRKVTNGEIN